MNAPPSFKNKSAAAATPGAEDTENAFTVPLPSKPASLGELLSIANRLREVLEKRHGRR